MLDPGSHRCSVGIAQPFSSWPAASLKPRFRPGLGVRTLIVRNRNERPILSGFRRFLSEAWDCLKRNPELFCLFRSRTYSVASNAPCWLPIRRLTGRRVRTGTGWSSSAWIAAASVAMGGGILSMHFIALLAFRMPMPVTYDLTLTLVSLLLGLPSRRLASPSLPGDGTGQGHGAERDRYGIGHRRHALHRNGCFANARQSSLRSPPCRCLF